MYQKMTKYNFKSNEKGMINRDKDELKQKRKENNGKQVKLE